MKPILEKEFNYNGLNCYVLMMPYGYRCGYVEIPKGFEYYGQECTHLECHGGITYAEDYLATVSNDEDDVWYIGFDCAHAWDSPDYEKALELYKDNQEACKDLQKRMENGYLMLGDVRTLDYCIKECEKIVDQVI